MSILPNTARVSIRAAAAGCFLASPNVFWNYPQLPVLNEELCFSLPRYSFSTPHTAGQGLVHCGTVADVDRSWMSEYAGHLVYGAALDSTKTSKPGDSGGPIYRDRGLIGYTNYYTPMGVQDHEKFDNGQAGCQAAEYGCYNIYFAIVKEAIEQTDWDANQYNP